MKADAAATAAGWAVERWRDIKASLPNDGASVAWRRVFGHVREQVYYVLPSCRTLIADAAGSMDRLSMRSHQELTEGPDMAKIWIFDAPQSAFAEPIWADDQGVPGTVVSALIGLASYPTDYDGKAGVMNLAFEELRNADGRPGFIYRWWAASASEHGGLFHGHGYTSPGNAPTKFSPATFDMIGFRGDFTAWILAANAFCRQRLVNVAPYRPGRASRKRLEKVDVPASLNPVNLVLLRAVDRADADRAESLGVAWNCRWLVNGHWRNQFRPSTGEHFQKWITAYVKGPADKPFVAKERRIAVVH